MNLYESLLTTKSKYEAILWTYKYNSVAKISYFFFFTKLEGGVFLNYFIAQKNEHTLRVISYILLVNIIYEAPCENYYK